MADPTNTGPGGFEIDGNQELFDVGLPEPADPSQPYGPAAPTVDVSAGFIDADGKPKDLTNVTKTTLAQYLSNVTKGTEGYAKVANDYPIDPGLTTVSTTATDGNPALQTPGAAPPGNSAAFAPSNASIDPFSPSFTKISPGMVKGKSTLRGVDGNDLLPGIPGDVGYTASDGSIGGQSTTNPKPVPNHADTTAVVRPYVSAILASNRFALAGTNAGQTAYGLAPSGNAGFNPALAQQSKLGVYDPKASTLTPDQLATIGPLLTLRAAKSLGSTGKGADPNAGGLQAGAILPSTAQLGLATVDVSNLLASDVIANITSDVLDASDVLDIGSTSWGVMNDVDDPYYGTDALGMLALATALVAGVELLFDGLDILLGTITPQTKSATRDNQGRYTLGEYFAGTKAGNKAAAPGIGGALSALTSLNFGALLGILPTSYPFKKALSTGTNAFFGIPESSGILGQVTGALKAATDSPGYNSIVARAIIRSGITIVDALKKIGGNLVNAITQILAFIDTIKSSKLISACNVFAQLGDAILSDPAKWADPDQPTKQSSMDALSNDVPGSAVSKSRLQGVLKLAWASNRAPANMLLPASILGLDAALASQANLGQFSPFLGLGQDGYSLLQSTLTNTSDMGRIDPDDAADFEAALEASYVPFYFHDIRTNEMVSFHAFLASLTEDYSATYEGASGIGRVEQARIYKGTDRKLNMSFYVAATSMADFDDMWVKINKLVTMIYPQYTQGVQLTSADGSNYVFTQPFSQLVGASPLIRIRLGDLIRSNYTPFALGRLFGMGNQNFALNDGTTFVGADALAQGDVDNLAAAIQSAQANPQSEIYTPAFSTYVLYNDAGGGGLGVSLPSPPLPGGIGGSSGPQFASIFQPTTPVFEVKAVKVDPNNPANIIGQVQFRTDPAFQAWAAADGVMAALNDTYNNPDDLTKLYIGAKYTFPIANLTMTEGSKSTLLTQLNLLSSVVSSNDTFASNVADFLDPANNALAKSFKDTAGKGLAGFIDNMAFDWMDKVTWETQNGRVAPKLCKVTISFTPQHDISPGLDHLGFNRSPLYPVGVMGPVS